MPLDNFNKIGLIVVIILLIGVVWALTEYGEKVSTVTTTTPVTTQPTTTLTTTTIPGITTTSTTSSTTTTQPIGTYGDDVDVTIFSSSRSTIFAGSFVDLRVYFRNSDIHRIVKITQVELSGVDIRKGSAGSNIWGIPDGDYVITPDESLSPREGLEYWWVVQAPNVDTKTRYSFIVRIYYLIDSTKYYTESKELSIIVNP